MVSGEAYFAASCAALVKKPVKRNIFANLRSTWTTTLRKKKKSQSSAGRKV